MPPSRTLLILLIGLALSIASGVDAGALISVDASPLSIPADGRSYSQILVTVFDQTGAPVPDGAEVRLTTSAGDITPIVYTSGGRAVGILTASTFPQVAVINAITDGASVSTQVEFSSSSSEELSGTARTIRMEGGSLAYSVDQDTVLGSNGVVMEYRGLTIEAASIQVCQTFGQIRAQGDVVVRKDDQTLTADELACDTSNDRIRLLDYGDEPSARTFDVGKLKPIGQASPPADSYEFLPLMNVDGKTWIVCGRLVLIPGQRVLFYKASVYVGDAKVMTMPYYSYSYEKRESILQQVSYTSRDGMLIDLPFYYRMTDSGTGALKLRYAADGTETGSYYRPPKGLSIGLEQEYAMGRRSQGRLFVDSIANENLAFEMAHHLEYGAAASGGRADVWARYQPSSSYAKDIYNTTLSVMGSLRKYDYTIYGYLGGDSYQQYDYLDPDSLDYISQSYGSIEATLRPRTPILMGNQWRLTSNLSVGYGNLWDSSGGPGLTSLYESLGLNVNRSIPISRTTALSLDGTAALTSTAHGDSGTSLRLRPTLRNSWRGGSASISYTLSLQDGVTDSVSSLAKHQLGGNLFMSVGGKWSLHSSVNYGLDNDRLTLYSGLQYRIAEYWQIRSSYSLYRYAYQVNDRSYSYSTSYLKVGIYRPVGTYEIGLAWSPDGQNYGIEKGKRLWLEVGGGRF